MDDDADSGMEDTFEIINVRGTARGNRYLNQAIESIRRSHSKYPIATKSVLGATGGYVTGLVFKKVGKVAASAIGGGLLILQIGYRSGYITINTGRVNRDARNFERRVREEIRRNESSLSNFSTQTERFVRKNVPVVVGFAAGFLLGLAT